MFDDFDWSRIVQAGIQSIPGIAASVMGNRVQQQGNQQAVDIANAAAGRKEALIRDASKTAMTTQAPALSHFQATMGANPSQLTPQQQITLEDSQRELNNSNIPGRVGGRAFSRIFADSTNRIRAGAVNDNLARQDRAAQGVASIGAQQGQIALGTGRDLALNTGAAADTAGNAAVSNATNTADTYGQIANFFANSMKDGDKEGRQSRYNKRITETG